MARYAASWLNQQGLSQLVDDVEKDLADGTVLAALLRSKGHLSEEKYSAILKGEGGRKLSIADRLKNFDVLYSALTAPEIRLDLRRRLLRDIVTEGAGAASELVLKYKEFLEMGPAHKRSTKGHVSAERAAKAVESVRPKVFQRAALTNFGKDDFLESLVEEVGYDNLKELDMRVHLRPFYDFAKQRERDIIFLDTTDAESAAQRHEAENQKTHEAMRSTQQMNAKTDASRKENWQRTIELLRDAELQRLQYELYVEKAEDIRRHNSRVWAARDAESGVDWFEKNLRRLGAGGPAGDEDLGEEERQPRRENYDRFKERLSNANAKEALITKHSAAQMLSGIKQRAKNRAQARYERDRRRRKSQVDQERASKHLEAKHNAQARLEAFVRNACLRRQSALLVYKKRRMLESSEIKSTKMAEHMKKKQEEQFLMDFQQRSDEIRAWKSSDDEVAREKEKMEKFADFNAKKIAKKREHAKAASKAALEDLLDMVDVICSWRGAQNGASLYPSDYNELLSQYVRGGEFEISRTQEECEKSHGVEDRFPSLVQYMHSRCSTRPSTRHSAQPNAANSHQIFDGDAIVEKTRIWFSVQQFYDKGSIGIWEEPIHSNAPGAVQSLANMVDVVQDVEAQFVKLLSFEQRSASAGTAEDGRLFSSDVDVNFVLSRENLTQAVAAAVDASSLFVALAILPSGVTAHDAKTFLGPIASASGMTIVTIADAIDVALQLGKAATNEDEEYTPPAEGTAELQLQRVGQAIIAINDTAEEEGVAPDIPATLRFEALRAFTLLKFPPEETPTDDNYIPVTARTPHRAAVLFAASSNFDMPPPQEENKDDISARKLPQALEAWLGAYTDAEYAKFLEDAAAAAAAADGAKDKKKENKKAKTPKKKEASAEVSAWKSVVDIAFVLKLNESTEAEPAELFYDQQNTAAFACTDFLGTHATRAASAEKLSLLLQTAACRSQRRSQYDAELAELDARLVRDETLFEEGRQALSAATEFLAKAEKKGTDAIAVSEGQALVQEKTAALEVLQQTLNDTLEEKARDREDPWVESLNIDLEASTKLRRDVLSPAETVWTEVVTGERTLAKAAWLDSLATWQSASYKCRRALGAFACDVLRMGKKGPLECSVDELTFQFSQSLSALDADFQSCETSFRSEIYRLREERDRLVYMSASSLRSVQLRAKNAKPSVTDLEALIALRVDQYEETLGDIAEQRFERFSELAVQIVDDAKDVADNFRQNLQRSFRDVCPYLVSEATAGTTFLEQSPFVTDVSAGNGIVAAVEESVAFVESLQKASEEVKPAADVLREILALNVATSGQEKWAALCGARLACLARTFVVFDGIATASTDGLLEKFMRLAKSQFEMDLKRLEATITDVRKAQLTPLLPAESFVLKVFEPKTPVCSPEEPLWRRCLVRGNLLPTLLATRHLAKRLRKDSAGRECVPQSIVLHAVDAEVKHGGWSTRWTDQSFLRTLTRPFESRGFIRWRQFLYAIFCGHLPRDPSGTDLLRLATDLAESAYESALSTPDGRKNVLSGCPLSVSKTRMLDHVHFWFDDAMLWDGERDHISAMKETFAEIFREPSGHVDVCRAVTYASCVSTETRSLQEASGFDVGLARACLALTILVKNVWRQDQKHKEDTEQLKGMDKKIMGGSVGVEDFDLGADKITGGFKMPVRVVHELLASFSGPDGFATPATWALKDTTILGSEEMIPFWEFAESSLYYHCAEALRLPTPPTEAE